MRKLKVLMITTNLIILLPTCFHSWFCRRQWTFSCHRRTSCRRWTWCWTLRRWCSSPGTWTPSRPPRPGRSANRWGMLCGCTTYVTGIFIWLDCIQFNAGSVIFPKKELEHLVSNSNKFVDIIFRKCLVTCFRRSI